MRGYLSWPLFLRCFVVRFSIFLPLLFAFVLFTSACAATFDTRDGGIIRGPTGARRIALVFTGHEFAESGQIILDQLARHEAKASFFLTGDFLANTNFASLVHR